MSVPYTSWRYIWPPRTKMKIPPGPGAVRSMWEKFPDAIAQFKLNGTRNSLVQKPDGSREMWNRHQEQQKQYVLTPEMNAELDSLNLPRGHWTILDGELLHAKTKRVKDTLYVFDVLVWESQHLIGTEYRERYELVKNLLKGKELSLDFLFGNGKIDASKQAATQRILYPTNWLANEWEQAWQNAQQCDFCEGLVLKRLDSKLESGNVEYNNCGFMCRVRKPHKNSLF
jgi:hypothetical protein